MTREQLDNLKRLNFLCERGEVKAVYDHPTHQSIGRVTSKDGEICAGYWDTRQVNMRLIAAALNALPELLEIAERAMEPVIQAGEAATARNDTELVNQAVQESLKAVAAVLVSTANGMNALGHSAVCPMDLRLIAQQLDPTTEAGGG